MSKAVASIALRATPKTKRARVWACVSGAWLTSEACFWEWRRRRVSDENALLPDTSLPHLSAEARAKLFENCLRNLPAPGGKEGAQSFVSGWFFKAPVSYLTVGDIREWLAWGLFMRRSECLNSEEYSELDGYISQLEQTSGNSFMSDSGGLHTSRCMKPTWEPFLLGQQVSRLPLLFYMLVVLADLGASFFLRSCGFEYHHASNNELCYWVREQKGKVIAASRRDEEQAPVTFFAHGMGIGLLPYCVRTVPALMRLQDQGNIGSLVLLRFPEVSMSLFESSGRPTLPPDLVTAIKEILSNRGCLDHSGLQRRPALLIGHSYGTLKAAQLLQAQPDLFQGLVLLDPMCFMLHLATTTYEFCYAYIDKPRSLSGMIAYTVCSEFLICICMRRYFHWQQNCLWLEQFADASGSGHSSSAEVEDRQKMPKMLVVLAERDNKTCPEEIERYIERQEKNNRPELLWLPGAVHGDCVLSKGAADVVAKQIGEFVSAL